jgi:hypothetical protein
MYGSVTSSKILLLWPVLCSFSLSSCITLYCITLCLLALLVYGLGVISFPAEFYLHGNSPIKFFSEPWACKDFSTILAPNQCACSGWIFTLSSQIYHVCFCNALQCAIHYSLCNSSLCAPINFCHGTKCPTYGTASSRLQPHSLKQRFPHVPVVHVPA